MKIPTGKKAIAHHEAGHAVIARVLGLDVVYATLRSLNGGLGDVLRVSAAHRAPDDLEALKKDAIVSLAGPMAQLRYQPLSQGAQQRAWKDGGWQADRRDAENSLVMLLLRQHDEPVVLGHCVLEGERAEEFCQLFNGTRAKTADLVKENWPAIGRVAVALLGADRPLSQDEVDALIAQNE
jgi:hypothetical protein